jgi:hypothetical protein
MDLPPHYLEGDAFRLQGHLLACLLTNKTLIVVIKKVELLFSVFTPLMTKPLTAPLTVFFIISLALSLFPKGY